MSIAVGSSVVYYRSSRLMFKDKMLDGIVVGVISPGEELSEELVAKLVSSSGLVFTKKVSCSFVYGKSFKKENSFLIWRKGRTYLDHIPFSGLTPPHLDAAGFAKWCYRRYYAYYFGDTSNKRLSVPSLPSAPPQYYPVIDFEITDDTGKLHKVIIDPKQYTQPETLLSQVSSTITTTRETLRIPLNTEKPKTSVAHSLTGNTLTVISSMSGESRVLHNGNPVSAKVLTDTFHNTTITTIQFS